MKLLLVLSVILAVLCQLGDAGHKRGSFYGLRKMPRFNRRLIPSRFYPNLYYKPVLVPGRNRVYRSAPEEEGAKDVMEHQETEVPPPSRRESDIEKRSVGKKLAHLPKWKTDIILNLFGRGSNNGEHPHFGSHFDEFSSFGGQDRSIEVEDLLDEVLISPEGSEGVLDEESLEESVMIGDEGSVLDEGESEDVVGDLMVDEEEMDLEDSEMIDEVVDIDETSVEEVPLEKAAEEAKPASSRRRRNVVVKTEEEEDDKDKEDEKAVPQPHKRSANSPYLVDEETEEFTEVNDFSEGGFLTDNGNDFVQEEEITFDEEQIFDEGYQPVKRSAYGSGDSFSAPSNVNLSPRFNNQPRRKTVMKPKKNTFSSPRNNILESSPSSLPDGYSRSK